MTNLDTIEKTLVDIGAIGSGILPLFVESLPHFTSLFGLIWIIIRIYESHTVQKFLNKKEVKDESSNGL